MSVIKKTVLVSMITSVFLTGCISVNISNTKAPEDRDKLYQVDLLQSLTAGQYDGVMEVGELPKHGDIGLGTFEGVNGEMIMLDGTVYQALSDGSVAKADLKEKVPFCTVTYMDNDLSFSDFAAENFEDYRNQLDKIVADNSANHFYFVRAEGVCKDIVVRSVVKQEKPYRTLDAALQEDQREFGYSDIKGTLVGLYCPPYMNMLNSPGWHFHFISDDKEKGGHILSFEGFEGTVNIDRFSEFEMTLGDEEIFNSLDLSVDQNERIKEVEQGGE